ncbi:class I SAM-dependent methyltransferase [Methylomonas sp. MgM2]
MNILKKIKRKIIYVFPWLRWIGLISPFKKFINSIAYNFWLYKLSGKKFKGLNLGSGGTIIPNYLNIDGNPFTYCDVVAGLEKIHLRDGAVDYIYASHIFEHIPREKTLSVLNEWSRVLSQGGKAYICVPDLEILSKIYLENLSGYDKEKNSQLVADLACDVIFGGQVNRFDFHFYGYSFQTLRRYLKDAGFSNVERFERAKMEDFPPVDASFARIGEIPISLNVVASK